MPYLYETHLHTSLGSLCGRSRGPEYVRFYKSLGYAGIFVTDHFVHSNCAVDPSLPWPEFVRQFCRGYEETREAGEREGLSVFFGWEVSYACGDDYLIYGLDPQWLLGHPEMADWTVQAQHREVRRHGGCVVQAHPFRDRHYIPAIRLSPGCVDAMEVANGGNLPEQDRQAALFARENGLLMTAGTDLHAAGQFPPEQMLGVAFERPLKSVHDFVDAILSRRPFRLQVPPERRPEGGSAPAPRLPVLLEAACAGECSLPGNLLQPS